MSTYEPGTIARITLANGVVHPVALRLPLHEGGWATATAKYVHSVQVTDVRPLVVLNDSGTSFARMVSQLREVVGFLGNRECAPRFGLTLTNIANQIEAQTKPPKPAEPTGLGAVVEDSDGVNWIRTCVPCDDCLNKPWQRGPMRRNWLIVDAVRVLSEGVTA